jgi:hypothetical protein
MLLFEIQSLLDNLSLPCSFQELVNQYDLCNIPPRVQEELFERFSEFEQISEEDFEELENYFDEEFFKQDE